MELIIKNLIKTRIFLMLSFILLIYNNCNIIKGECVSGNCINGKGKMIYSKYRIYEGEWKDGEPHGFGIEMGENYNYEGNWKNGKKNGFGKEKDFIGNYYEGNFLDGQENGKGKLIYSSGDEYDGDWKDGLSNGFGTASKKDGTRYIGEWVSGKRTGKGKYIYPNGTVLEGQWIRNNYCITGDCWNGSGKLLILWNDSIYTCEFKNGNMHGKGKLVDNKGNIIHEGEFEDNGRKE